MFAYAKISGYTRHIEAMRTINVDFALLLITNIYTNLFDLLRVPLYLILFSLNLRNSCSRV